MPRRLRSTTLLDARLTALLAALPAALAGERDGVHQARVASRRLREALPIVGSAMAPDVVRQARREVRGVTRAFGLVRELDVSQELFEARASTSVLPLAVVVAVRSALAAARARALRRVQVAFTPARRRRLHASLEVFAAALPASGAAAMGDALDARLAVRAARVRDAVKAAGTLYVPERLHAVRIAVKQLRYATELAGDLRRARAASRATALRAVQDLLGLAHDLHVLAEQLVIVQRRTIRTSRATARGIGAVVADLDRECRSLHAAFMSCRPSLLALCASIEVPRPGRRLRVA